MDRLRVPSDAELMKIAIADLLNSTLSIEDRQRALQELLILVEPIDNARGEFDRRCGRKTSRWSNRVYGTSSWLYGNVRFYVNEKSQ